MTRSEIRDADRAAIAAMMESCWGSRLVVCGGEAFYPDQEDGFIERRDGDIVGLLTYRARDREMELLTLNAMVEGRGIGTSLVLSAIDRAREMGCHRVWLITTNDNLKAIGLYQRLGFRMIRIDVDAVTEARKMKPEIPRYGHRGVPIQDEVVMELPLAPALEAPDQK